MRKYLNGFTLIEMLIVIIIISLMLLITLNLSSNQTKTLRYRISREIIISNYNTFVIRAITSNSDGLDLKFSANTGFALVSSEFNFEATPSMKIISLNKQGPGSFSSFKLLFSGGINQCVWYNGTTPTIGTGIEMILQDTNTMLTGALCINLSTCKLKEGGC